MAGCGCGSGSSVPEVVPIKLRSLDPAALERGRALCRMTAHSQCFASRKAANVAAEDACEQPLAGTILGGAARDDCARENLFWFPCVFERNWLHAQKANRFSDQGSVTGGLSRTCNTGTSHMSHVSLIVTGSRRACETVSVT